MTDSACLPVLRPFAFDLDMRDYDLWKDEPNPAFLSLYEAATCRAYWLFVQLYFKAP